MKNFTTITAVTAVLMVGAMPIAAAQAQKFPSKPVQVVLPVPPGGAMDWAVRYLAKDLTARWGQPVIVENKPGAGGLIASDTVAHANSDGHTLLFINTAVTSYGIFNKTSFNVERDLIGLSLIMHTPYVVFANASLPVNSIEELVKHAKANPGKLNMANIPANNQELRTIQFLTTSGIDAARVSYSGAGPVIAALLSNEVQLYLGTPFGLTEHVKSGKLKALGIAANETISAFPGTPTLKAQGVDYQTTEWYGYFAPKKAPAEVVRQITADIAQVASMPENQEQIKARGYEPLTTTSEQLTKMVVDEQAIAVAIANRAGIKPN